MTTFGAGSQALFLEVMTERAESSTPTWRIALVSSPAIDRMLPCQ